MAMNVAGRRAAADAAAGASRSMAEINVTPMVDVMLVLLIIFMVSAPLLTVGVPIDLPQTQAKSLDQDKEPLTVSVNTKGKVFLKTPRSRSTNWCRSCRRSPTRAAAWTSASMCAATRRSITARWREVMGRLSAPGFKRVRW